jgi:DnaJ like chaperone protein
MNFWSNLIHFANGFLSQAGHSLMELLDAITARFDSRTRRQMAFTVSMIALAAKMARADGVVTEDEVRAFYRLVDFPEAEQRNVKRLYDLARQDVAGFDHYARRIAKALDYDSALLEDVLDGLFHIAKADGLLHRAEDAFLRQIAEIFQMSENDYERLCLRHFSDGKPDAYSVLGATPNMTKAQIRQLYLKLVRAHHPDSMVARGVPPGIYQTGNRAHG